jgi:hypothetical protein
MQLLQCVRGNQRAGRVGRAGNHGRHGIGRPMAGNIFGLQLIAAVGIHRNTHRLAIHQAHQMPVAWVGGVGQ